MSIYVDLDSVRPKKNMCSLIVRVFEPQPCKKQEP
jgi:hypothetical protein